MEVYLPIAEVQINVLLILFVSYVIGFLSGLFGVGGGFLMTPFLIFLGIYIQRNSFLRIYSNSEILLYYVFALVLQSKVKAPIEYFKMGLGLESG